MAQMRRGGRRGGPGVPRRPFLLRRRAAAGADAPPPQLVTTHPAAVRQGSFSGPIWLVPATLWARGQQASEWPPPTQGPAAVARKFHATLLRPGPGHGPRQGPGSGAGSTGGTASEPADGPAAGPESSSGSGSGALLVLVPERSGRGGKGGGGPGGPGGNSPAWVVPLEGVTVDLMRDALGNGTPWTRRCPLQLSHTTRPLLLGESTLYMFAESGSAKEQWYAALEAAVAPQSLLAATQQLYADYCTHMASLQVVQPPPLPPLPPATGQPGTQSQQPASKPAQQQRPQAQGQQQAGGGKGAPAKKPPPPPPPKERQRGAQGGGRGSAAPGDAAAPAPRPRGRNPFGFILSRFGRGAPRGATAADARPSGVGTPAAPASTADTAPPSRVPSVAGMCPGGTPRQHSAAELQGLQSGAAAQAEGEAQAAALQLDAVPSGPPALSAPGEEVQEDAATRAASAVEQGGLPSQEQGHALADQAADDSSPSSLPIAGTGDADSACTQQEAGHGHPVQHDVSISQSPQYDRTVSTPQPPSRCDDSTNAGEVVGPSRMRSAPQDYSGVSDIFAASLPFSPYTRGEGVEARPPAGGNPDPRTQGVYCAPAADVVAASDPAAVQPAGGASGQAAPGSVSAGGSGGSSTAGSNGKEVGIAATAAQQGSAHAHVGAGAGVGPPAAVLEAPLASEPAARETGASLQGATDAGALHVAAAAAAAAAAQRPHLSPHLGVGATCTSSIGSKDSGALSPARPKALSFGAWRAEPPLRAPSPTPPTLEAARTPRRLYGSVDVVVTAPLQGLALDGARGQSLAAQDEAPLPVSISDVSALRRSGSAADTAALQTASTPLQEHTGRLPPWPPSPFSVTHGSPGAVLASPSPIGVDEQTTEGDGAHSSPKPLQPLPPLHVAVTSPPLPPLPAPPSGMLRTQQTRHGGSMPDLLEVARAAEAATLGANGQAGASSGVATPADSLRRSLDLRMTVHQPATTTATPPVPGAVHGSAIAGTAARLAGSGAGAAEAMPRALSKQDLKRLQREEQERAKQEQQRAKAAARAAEEARRAEERAARERARSEAQLRRQAEEAQAKLAKERARSLKQMRSAKSLQDLAAVTVAAGSAAAAATPSATTNTASASGPASTPPPPPSSRSSAPGTGVAESGAASPLPVAASPPGSPSPSLAAVPPTALGAGEEQPKGTQPPGPLPAPSAPPPGALVEGLHGLNMLLVRIGFELLRRRGFESWLARLIQSKLDEAPRPGFLHRLTLRRFDLGCSAPQLRDIRAVAGPNNFGPGSATWPQLALQVVWVGNAAATISTKIDFDQAAAKLTEQRDASSAGGSAAAAPAPAAAPGTAAAAPAASSSHGSSSGAEGPHAHTHAPATGAEAAAVSQVPTHANAFTPSGQAPSSRSLKVMSADGVKGGDGDAGLPVTADGISANAGSGGGGVGDGRHADADGRCGVDGAVVSAAASAGDVQSAATIARTEADGSAARDSTSGGGSDGGGGSAGTSGKADAPGSSSNSANDGSASGPGSGPAPSSSGGGGGKFWWNFVPFFSILRKTGQALAANIAGSLSGTPVEVRLAGRRFEGTLLLWLAPPPSDRLWLSFAEPPSMDFTVTPVLGNRKLAGGLVVGRLSAWVRSKVIAGLSRAMVYPACVDIQMGKLLLSIDSPEEAVRSFTPPPPPPGPPPPPPAHMPAAAPSAAAVVPRDGQHKQQAQHPQPASAPAAARSDPAIGSSVADLGPTPDPALSSRPPGGRPPRPPLSATPTCTTPAAMGLVPGGTGAGTRAVASVPAFSPPSTSLFPSASLPAAVPAPFPSTFSAAALAAATAAGLSGGSSGSLLESALRTMLRHTPSILGSSPGTLSPLDGLSEAEDDEGEDEDDEKEHEDAEHWDGHGDGGYYYDENGRPVGLYGPYSQYGVGGSAARQRAYGSADGGGTAGTEGRVQYGYGEGAVDASYFWTHGPGVPPPPQMEAHYGGWGAAAPAEERTAGSQLSSPPPAAQAQQQRVPRHSAGSATASAAPASAAPSFTGRLPQQAADASHAATPRPQQSHQQPQQQQPPMSQQHQAGAGGSAGGPRRGPFQWARGAAGAVARGVGTVGGAGMRGLGVVGAAVGQVVLGPVVHAGERAALQQQRQAGAAAQGPPSQQQLPLQASTSTPALSVLMQQQDLPGDVPGEAAAHAGSAGEGCT